MNEKLSQFRTLSEAEGLRKVAFIGVTLSVVSALVCAVSIPMLYSYMQYVHSSMQNEVDFCKARSSNVWKEIARKTQVIMKFESSLI